MSDSEETSPQLKKSQEPQGLGDMIQAQSEKWAPAFRMTILLCVSVVATLVRVFSVNSSYTHWIV